MKQVRVLVPFIDSETKTLYEAGREVELPEATIERVKAISVNMVLVLGDAEAPKKPRTKKVVAE
jgi:hypothetical protein